MNKKKTYTDINARWKDYRIQETIISESANWKPLIAKVSAACDYDYNELQDFIKALLIDSNFHDEAEKIYKFMNKI